MKTFFQILIVLTTFAIAACNQSPTNVHSDPLRKYQALKNDLPMDKAGTDTHAGPAVDEGVPYACQKPYDMNITDENGDGVNGQLQFIVDQEKTYGVILNSAQFPDLKLSLLNAPKGMSLKPTKTSGLWELSFKPTASQGNLNDHLVIKVQVPQTGCAKGEMGETLSINVNYGKPLPSISISGLDKSLFQYNETAPFTVDIQDPGLADSETAKPPQFNFDNSFGTTETLFLSAKDAVKCDQGQKIAAQTFRFQCSVDFNQIKMTSNQAFGHSDFKLFAVSANGEKSRARSIGLNIAFPPPTPAQTAAIDSDTASKSTAPKSKKSTSKKTKSKKSSPKGSNT